MDGQPIKLGDLVGAAQDNAKRLVEQYNSNPIFQQQGISYVQDPANPGRFIQVQGKSPIEQQQQQLSLEKSMQSLTEPSAANFSQDLLKKVQSGQYTATGEAGKKSREELISELQAQYGKAVDPYDISAQVYNTMKDTSGKVVTGQQLKQEDTQKAATIKANKDNLTSALSSLDTAASQLIGAGGATGPTGFLTKTYLGQWTNPSGYTYEQTKKDLAAQLTKAITGAARSSGVVYEGFLNSLPTVTDTPEVADQKLKNLYQQLTDRASALGINDVAEQYSDKSGTNSQQTSQSTGKPSEPKSTTVGKYKVEVEQ